jgi:integrase
VNAGALVNTNRVLGTDADMRRLKVPSKGQRDYRTKFPGLQLRHFASGVKCWFIHARIAGGKPMFIRLGEFPAMKFHQAEIACASARDSLRRGVDPRAQQQAEDAASNAANMTFGRAAEEWIAEQSRKLKPWRATTTEKVRFVLLGGRLEPWRKRRLGAIDESDVENLLADLAENTKQTFLAPLRGLFKWAVRRGYIPKSPVANITAPMPEGDAAPLIVFEEEGEPDFAEVKAFLQSLDALRASLPLSPWPTIYRLGLLTGARYSELVGLPRKEIVLDSATWKLPAERSKVKSECDRPLSAAAVALLRSIPGTGELMFPGKIAGHALSKTGREPAILSAMLAERGYKTGFWYGRLRDTVASWLEFQPDATERAMAVILNHKPPRDNTRRRHYTKISGRKQARILLERWAAQLQRIQEGNNTEQNVVAFPAAAA